MNAIAALCRSPRVNLYCGALLAGVWGAFAYAHLQAFLARGDWAMLLFGLSETMVAVLFLFRSAPQSISTHPLDWVSGIAGTFAPLLLRPSAWTVLAGANQAIAVGALLQIAALLSLNRSIAMIAARRRIKTRGLYRLVRHPIYASYLFTQIAYLLSNASTGNLLVVLAGTSLQVLRLLREEQHLSQDPAYCDYMRQVPYRLLPFIF